MRLYYRWFLALLFVVCLVIFWQNYISNFETEESIENENQVVPTFKWIDHKALKRCRNSMQGSRIIVDDRGYICEWSDRLSNGCCFPKGVTSKQYVCKSCLANQCCNVYEHCVSCCQHPDKQTLLRSILANNSRKILKMVGDQFEFCLAKCRTSSESVIHENHYRNSKHKHCFGAKKPETEPS